jgi:hypothetical protein
MKTPEFARAYNWPRPLESIERAYRDGVPFDKRMGDMTLVLLELEGPDRQLGPHQDELSSRLHQEFTQRVTSLPIAREMHSRDQQAIFSPELTPGEAASVMETYSELQYEAFVAGWEEMIFCGNYSQQARREELRHGQLILAQQAIDIAAVRHPLTLRTTDYPFFSPEMYWARRLMNGILNEYDTAIALMSLAMSDENLIVVNAPKRFEQHDHPVAVDFLAYHRVSDHVIGIQAKSTHDQDQAAEYDDERVMMVFGDRDLKGAIGTRTRPGKTLTREVIWPGILSAEVLSSLKLHGHDADIKGDFNMPTALHYQRIAASCQTHPMNPKTKIKGSVANARAAIADELYRRLEVPRPRREKAASNGTKRNSRSKTTRRR